MIYAGLCKTVGEVVEITFPNADLDVVVFIGDGETGAFMCEPILWDTIRDMIDRGEEQLKRELENSTVH